MVAPQLFPIVTTVRTAATCGAQPDFVWVKKPLRESLSAAAELPKNRI